MLRAYGIDRLLQENGSHADDWIFGDGFEAAAVGRRLQPFGCVDKKMPRVERGEQPRRKALLLERDSACG